ncbi:MAG: replicative DNA helicase [Brachymonas sp.]
MPKKKNTPADEALSQADIDAQPFMADEDDAPYLAPDAFDAEDDALPWLGATPAESRNASGSGKKPARKPSAKNATAANASNHNNSSHRAQRTARDGLSTPDGSAAVSSFSAIPDAQIAQLRIPPHSLEAESSVLGGLLLDNHAWENMGDLLVADDFYRYEHRLIFAAMADLMNASKPADVITVFEALQRKGKAEEVGGLPYINSLAQFVPSASNIRRYAEIVRERSILRKLVSASDEISTRAFNTQGLEVAKVLDEAEQKIFKIGEESSRMKQGFVSMDTLVVDLMDKVQELADNPTDVTGVPTGFYDLDRMTSGLQAGDLVVLAARPSMGKTSLAINIAEHVALNEHMPVAVFSMEMGAAQLAVRIVGSIGRIDQGRLRTGQLSQDEWPRFAEAIDQLKDIPLHIDESSGLTPSELRANARRLARREGKLGLIVVDYLQLMSGSSGGREENRATELGEISRGLKMLAKELQCPVIALSQLSRGVESRTDKRPMMSDLRESGAIEQDADIIMFIYRDDYYNKESKDPGVAEVIIAKQRNGPTGTVRLSFLKPLTRFESLAQQFEDEY